MISNPEHQAMTERLACILSSCARAGDARRGLSDAYRRLLPDKSEAQGELMTENMLECMSLFYSAYDAAAADPAGFAARFLRSQIKDLPLAEQCGYLREFYAALSAVCSLPCLGPEKERYTEQDRESLLCDAVSGVLCLPAPGSGPLPEKERLALAILRRRSGEHNAAAWSALTLYALSKSPDWAMDITLQQAVYACCAQEAMQETRAAATLGHINGERAEKLLAAADIAATVLILVACVFGGIVGVLVSAGAAVGVAGTLLVMERARQLSEPVYSAAADMLQSEDLRLPPLVISMTGLAEGLEAAPETVHGPETPAPGVRARVQEDEEEQGVPDLL